jgi:glycosidase
MAFWLDRGVAGFRVDMAYSLVKGDPDRAATAELWADLSSWLHETYPDAVLLRESDIEAPVDLGLRSGFDGDFFLVNQAAHSALFNNGRRRDAVVAARPRAVLLRRRRPGRARLPRPVPGSGTSTSPATAPTAGSF